MIKHEPYGNRLCRAPDFIVAYTLDPCDELRLSKPGQGMRVDFLYDGESPTVEGIHMIWPEILDEDGRVMMDTTPGILPKNGKANMWVFDPASRDFHAKKLKIGAKGYWVRGSYRLARVVVIEICSLAR